MPNVGTTGVAATNRTPALYRRGIVTIEIILTLPIFIIAVMAIVELGLLVSNEQIVEMSSRAGTQVASELATIPSSGSVPVSVQAAVARELAQIGATNYHVRLEHNINFSGAPGATMASVVLTTVTTGGPPNCPPPPTIALAPNRRYVRVTVCVYSTALTPNLLNNFGVNLSNRVSDQTTLRRYVK